MNAGSGLPVIACFRAPVQLAGLYGEYRANFRRDVEAYVSLEQVQAVIVRGGSVSVWFWTTVRLVRMCVRTRPPRVEDGPLFLADQRSVVLGDRAAAAQAERIPGRVVASSYVYQVLGA